MIFLRLKILKTRWIIAGEAMIGKLWRIIVSLVIAASAIDPVNGNEAKGIRANIVAHAFQVILCGEQLFTVGRINAIIVGMGDGGGWPAAYVLRLLRHHASFVQSWMRSCRAQENHPPTQCAFLQTWLRLAECLRRTPNARICWVGSMKVRPT